jgi:membrane protein required for colicin V production
MSYLDIIIAIPLIWGLYRGFTKGFIIELATLVALCLGMIGAIKLSDLVTIYCREHFGWTSEYLPLISYVITFVIIVLLVYLIAKAIEQFVRLAALGMVNRIFGSVFGVFKFAIALSCLIYVVNTFRPGNKIIPEEQQEKSFLFKPVASIATTVIPVFQKNKLVEGNQLSVVGNR